MVYERTFKDVDNFVFDLDGTVWAWNELKSGVTETIQALEKDGKQVHYLTNSAVLTREGYAEKLRKLGLNADPDRVLPASTIAARALDAADVRDVFVIGEEGLRKELSQCSVKHTEDADHVLCAVDRNLTYWKLAKAADIIRETGNLWATAADSYWWAGERRLPGTNALVSALTEVVGETDVTVLGKPSDYAADVVMEEWSLRPGNTAIIGDSLHTDIALGRKMGWRTALVLGGATTEDEARTAGKDVAPDIVFRSFRRITMKV